MLYHRRMGFPTEQTTTGEFSDHLLDRPACPRSWNSCQESARWKSPEPGRSLAEDLRGICLCSKPTKKSSERRSMAVAALSQPVCRCAFASRSPIHRCFRWTTSMLSYRSVSTHWVAPEEFADVVLRKWPTHGSSCPS